MDAELAEFDALVDELVAAEPVEPLEADPEEAAESPAGLLSAPLAPEPSDGGLDLSESVATAGAVVPPFLKSVAYQPVPFS